jgi:outer membrane immunogenic protein
MQTTMRMLQALEIGPMQRVAYAGLIALFLPALAGESMAADLSPNYPPYYRTPAYAPAFGWGGFYLGVNGGGGWGRSTWDSTGEFDLSGGVLGGTAGFGWQVGQVRLGFAGDLDWSGLHGTTSAACPAGCSTQTYWLGTARGRIGYAFDRILPYVTGGLAVGDISASTPGFAGASQTNLGWAIGAGVEVAVFHNWSAKAEYMHIDLGSFNCGLACGLTTPDNVSYSANLLRGGVNYHF